MRHKAVISDLCHAWSGKLYLEVREADGSRGKLNQSLDEKRINVKETPELPFGSMER